MLTSPSRIKQKPVLIVNDVPIKSEIESEESFSAPSNVHLLSSLRTGRASYFNTQPLEGHKGISSLECNGTYLDYSYYGDIEGNFSFSKEVVKGKDLQKVTTDAGSVFIPKTSNDVSPENTFVKLPTHKDIWVSLRLHSCIEQLLNYIALAQPKLIIVTGKWSLLFLTGLPSLADTAGTVKSPKPLGGLAKYRSSILSVAQEYCTTYSLQDHLLVPIWNPGLHGRSMPESVPIMELDLRKLGRMHNTIKEKGLEFYKKPRNKIFIAHTKDRAVRYLERILKELEKGPTLLSIDVETMHKRFIDCIGIAFNTTFVFVFPFASAKNPHYWSLEDETDITVLLTKVLTHKNARPIGQNFQYDCQYFYHNYGISIYAYHDTMVLHHCLYNYLPKDLAFLASLYVDHYVFWKDEIDAPEDSPETRWYYNGKDVLYTLEILHKLLHNLQEEDKKLQELYEFQVRKLGVQATKTMNRGVRVDRDRKDYLYNFFSEVSELVKEKINDILGMELNLNSVPQKKKLFKEFLGIELKLVKRKGGETSETLDSASMLEYIEKYPLYAPLLTLMLEYTAIVKFTKTFLGAKLDEHGRMRTQYKIAGPNTGRLASTKDVFDRGANLQNLPAKGRFPLHYTLEVLNPKSNGPTEKDMDNWRDFMESVTNLEEEEENEAV